MGVEDFVAVAERAGEEVAKGGDWVAVAVGGGGVVVDDVEHDGCHFGWACGG